MDMETLKCVVVGDGGVGKTCLLMSFAGREFSKGHVPSFFDDHSIRTSSILVDKKPYNFSVIDTAGREVFDALRPMAYPETRVFLVCFSVVSPDSFENVTEKWVPEVKRYCPAARLVLVGTKTDLRNDPETLEDLIRRRQRPVSSETGDKLARELKAVDYLECSALKREGVESVLYLAIAVARESVQKQKKNKCAIM